MRKVKRLAALGLVILIAACEPSLQPLFTEQEAVFDPNFLGTWVNEDGDTATFQKSATSVKLYSLSYKDAKAQKAAIFQAVLGRLGNSYYLDAIRRSDDLEGENEVATFGLVGVHWFFKVSLDGDVLHTAILTGEWCDQMASKNKLGVGHTRITGASVGFDAHTVLTASTDDLQKFILKNAQVDGAFPKPEEWRREK